MSDTIYASGGLADNTPALYDGAGDSIISPDDMDRSLKALDKTKNIFDVQNSAKSGEKYTSDDLRTLQELPLQQKIQVTMSRIIEFWNKYPHQIYCSFSGGKDSTVLLDIIRRIYPDTPAVYVDTGLEYPEVREFVKSVPNVIILRPKMSFRQVIETYGYPLISKEVSRQIAAARVKPNGRTAERFIPGNAHDEKYSGFSIVRWREIKDSDIPINDKCCYVMKKNPAKLFEKQSEMHPITGMMACESIARTTVWKKYGCNIFDAKRPLSNPMSFWTEQDVLEYLLQYKLPYASVYGEILRDENGNPYTTGCTRTGCVFCLFGAHAEGEPGRLQKLHDTHPTLFKYCMKPWSEGGLGMKDIIDKFNSLAPKSAHIYY